MRMQATALDAVEDLEEDAKPEDLMLSYVSGEKSKVCGRGDSSGHSSWACSRRRVAWTRQ